MEKRGAVREAACGTRLRENHPVGCGCGPVWAFSLPELLVEPELGGVVRGTIDMPLAEVVGLLRGIVEVRENFLGPMIHSQGCCVSRAKSEATGESGNRAASRLEEARVYRLGGY
jgi:hypothetical protein